VAQFVKRRASNQRLWYLVRFPMR